MREILKLSNIKVVGKFRTEGFEVIFVKVPVTAREKIVSLNLALNKGLIEITEVSESGRVPQLKLKNKSEYYVVGFRGDILVGGKQNRTLITTIIIAPNSEVVIPVSCVEAGRWHRRTRLMKRKSRAPLMIKSASMLMELNYPNRSHITRAHVQSMLQRETWRKIDLRMQALKTISKTRDVTEVIEKNVSEIEEKIEVPDEANGVIVMFDGEIVGGELFFVGIDKEYLKDTIASFYFDYIYLKSMKVKLETGVEKVLQIVDELSKSEMIEKGSIFRERAFAIKGKAIEGILTTLEDEPIHFEFTASKIKEIAEL